MAQWSKQFSGHTHRTRVEDCENALRAAGAAFRAAEAVTKMKKAKSVRVLAGRLVSARRHQLKTQLLKAQGASADRAQAHEAEISSLLARLEALDRNGLDMVLAEFGLEETGGAV